MRRFSVRSFWTCLFALLLFLPSTSAWAQATTGYTLETYPGVGTYVRSTDSGNPLPTGALISTGQKIHITGGAGWTPGDYTVTSDAGSGYAVLSTAPAAPTTGQTLGGGAANVANFVKVTSATGIPTITDDNQIQVPLPTITSGVGQVQVRLRIYSSISDTNPTNGAWTNYTGAGQVLSLAIPSQYQNTGKNLPQVAIGVKDSVAEWPACGWLAVSGYNVAQMNGDRYSSYNPFSAPKRGPPTDADILTILPLSRLDGKHISVVPIGDSITHGIYLAYPALLNSLYPNKFTYYDGGISGSDASQWLPGASNVHPSSTTGETYYNYVLHRAQEATSAGDVVIIPYCLGHNVDTNQIADDVTIINALKTALPNAYILVRPTRTTHRAEFTGAGTTDPDGFYLSVSDAQRALADGSSTDKILHGSEEFFPFFFSNQSLIDTGVTHPLAGEGQADHAHIEVKSLAQSLSIILPIPVSSITISPATVTLTTGQTSQTFTAVAKDSTGTALATQPTFTWTASGPSVNSAGVLSIPATYTVTASASSISGTATATLPTGGGGNLSPSDVQAAVVAALTAQGFTTARAAKLDNADAAVSTRLATSAYTAAPSALTVATAVMNSVVDGTLTVKQGMALSAAIQAGRYTLGTVNTNTHQQVTTYYRADGTTVLSTATVTFASDNKTVLSRSITLPGLP